MKDNEKMEKEVTELTERLLQLKSEVSEIQGKDISDSEFAKRFLKFSSTTWSRLQNGTYPLGKVGSIIDTIRDTVASIEAQLPLLREASEFSHSFIKTELAQATFGAVNRALAGIDDRRVVVVLAPTGHGKSAIGDYLRSKGAIYVEGRQAWRSSYRSFCSAIAAAAGRKLPISAAEYRVEEEMIQALSTKSGTLYIDEANTMSGACANAIKYIVNRTSYTVVIAAIPNMWDKFLSGNRDEVGQLVNRCQPVIRSTRISTKDVGVFLTSRKLPVSFASKVAAAANNFGGFRTVIAIANALSKIDSPTEEDLDSELKVQNDNFTASGIGLNTTQKKGN